MRHKTVCAVEMNYKVGKYSLNEYKKCIFRY